LINHGLAPYTSQTTSKTSVLNFLNYYSGLTNFITGGTYNGTTLVITFNGTQQNVVMTGFTDTVLTGGTYVITATTGTLKLTTNRNNRFDVTGFITGFTLTNQVQYNNNSNFSGSTTFFVDPTTSQSWNTGTNLNITNTAYGEDAMVNTTGSGNTIYGYRSFKSGTTGSYNTTFGYLVLQNGTNSDSNIGIGYGTMSGITSGYQNISVSSFGLNSITTGGGNILIGNSSLTNVTGEYQHILIGNNSKNNTPSTDAGSVTLGNYSVGQSNNSASIIIGDYAMKNSPSSDGNVIGFTIIGYSAYTTYNNNNDQNRLRATVIGFLGGATSIYSANVAALGNRTSNNGPCCNLGDYTAWNGNNNLNHMMGYKAGYCSPQTSNQGVGIMSCGGGDLNGVSSLYQANTGIGAYALKGTYQGNAGYQLTSIGYNSGVANNYYGSSAADTSVSIGSQSALKITVQGVSVGYSTTAVYKGVKVGAYCGYNGLGGEDNSTFVGYKSGYNSTGGYNTGFGQESLYTLVSGTNNVGVGFRSLYLTTGNTNTAVGYYSGYYLSAGTNNTVIGYNSQPSNTASTTNNEITLGNSSITTLRCQTTSITSLSDIRDKKEILPLNYGIDFINEIKPVKFTWDMRDGGKVGVKSSGFIAQQLQEVQSKYIGDSYLNLVSDNNPDRLEVSYMNILPTMIKSLQDLSKKNKELKERIKKLSI